MLRLPKTTLIPLLLLLVSGPGLAAEYNHATINRLLASEQAPDGVVFELISWDDKTWQWAAPMIADFRRQLQQKYPGIDVAVVSHGGEQFQLTKSAAPQQPRAIAQLQGLTEDGVNLHVCGTHSYWNDVEESAYLDMVNISPSGPAQVNDYIKLGYTHILLRKPRR
ncbi:MAG: DsrE family protein [Gammaproteobacteria bacterium]|nr:DsrE family protein [Gammaproteobacteria bacterium]